MSNQLPALPQGATGAPLVLAVNDRLRRIAQSTTTVTDAAAAAQSSADAAAKTADGALQAAENLSDVPNKVTACANLNAVTRIIIGFSPGSASATYNQTQMAEVIGAINSIITALNA